MERDPKMSDLPKDCGFEAIVIFGDMAFCCKKHKEMYEKRARYRMIDTKKRRRFK
jgi:hypothetical protein